MLPLQDLNRFLPKFHMQSICAENRVIAWFDKAILLEFRANEPLHSSIARWQCLA